MKIALGGDHGGYQIKEEIKKYLDEKEIQYVDYGSYDKERTDYPIYAEKVALAVQKGECDCGILLCRSSHGMTIAANKFRGIRAGAVNSTDAARLAKSDDNINIITIAGDYTSVSESISMIRIWLATEFKGGRYQERIDMLDKIENTNMK